LHSAVVPPQSNPVIAKADTGATAHYFKPEDSNILDNLKFTEQGPQVRLPNNAIIKADQVGNLPHMNLPLAATETHTFKDLKSASLISIGQLCDVGCQAVFQKQDLKIYDAKKQLVITGTRNLQDGLWDIRLASHFPTHTANAALRLDQTKVELAQHLHAACFSPVKSTFVKAIQNNWPGLTADLICEAQSWVLVNHVFCRLSPNPA
jgi:hypothetical protein